MSLRQHQPPAPARSPAAPAAPTAVNETAWQALCTHPADAPLVHVDHSHRFHTPADTDGFLKLKKVKTPALPRLTKYEEDFIARTRAFVQDPEQNLDAFRDFMNSHYQHVTEFTTNAAKQALKDVLDAAQPGEYTDAAKEVIVVLRSICCLLPLNATGNASR
jgi:hypothetical protein